MPRTTNFQSEFRSAIVDSIIHILKESFGKQLNIFIYHRRFDKATNLVFTYNEINFSIKIYEEDNLIVCGIESYEYEGEIIDDENLFLLLGKRNTLLVAEEQVEEFIHLILNREYDFVKKIISHFMTLRKNIDLSVKEQRNFYERLVKHFKLSN